MGRAGRTGAEPEALSPSVLQPSAGADAVASMPQSGGPGARGLRAGTGKAPSLRAARAVRRWLGRHPGAEGSPLSCEAGRSSASGSAGGGLFRSCVSLA